MEGETVIAGVDTHKDVHVLCLLDGLGRKIWSGSFRADPEGYDRLAEAIGDPGSCLVVGVEGTASYGAGLTRRLAELGYNVVEVLRPKRDKARPGEGKSDPLDAERAARKAASGRGCSVPKSQDGWVEAVRQLYVARRLAVATSTSCVACAKSMLTTAPSALRERFRGRERPKDLMPLLGLATLMWTVPGGAQETGGPYMRDPRHPRHFTDEFKRQIVDLYNAGKPKREIMDEYDLGKSTVERWIKSINATGSPRAADNRTPEQNRILELERENRRLRMEVDVLKQAALIYARK